MGLKTKHFKTSTEASLFARKVRGVVEGPFVDIEIHTEYIVFYRPEREEVAE